MILPSSCRKSFAVILSCHTYSFFVTSSPHIWIWYCTAVCGRARCWDVGLRLVTISTAAAFSTALWPRRIRLHRGQRNTCLSTGIAFFSLKYIFESLCHCSVRNTVYYHNEILWQVLRQTKPSQPFTEPGVSTPFTIHFKFSPYSQLCLPSSQFIEDY